MNDDEGAVATVIAVLLADGWHQIVPGSFSVGPLGLGGGADPSMPGFRFQEADAGRPYRPAVLAGPLDSIIAVRQVSSAVRRIGDQDRVRAPHRGQRADQGARLRVHAGPLGRAGVTASPMSGQEAGIWGGLTEANDAGCTAAAAVSGPPQAH